MTGTVLNAGMPWQTGQTQPLPEKDCTTGKGKTLTEHKLIIVVIDLWGAGKMTQHIKAFHLRQPELHPQNGGRRELAPHTH